MKTALLLSLLAVGASELDKLLEHLNVWVELGIKVAGLAAVLGGAWKWMIGPGWRRVRAAVKWVEAQLGLITTLDERLDGLDERLDRGEARFSSIDQQLEALAAEEAAAIRRAIRTGEKVQFTEDGHIDRRDSDPATDRRDPV